MRSPLAAGHTRAGCHSPLLPFVSVANADRAVRLRDGSGRGEGRRVWPAGCSLRFPISGGDCLGVPMLGLRRDCDLKDIVEETKSLGIHMEVAGLGREICCLVLWPDHRLEFGSRFAVLGLANEIPFGQIGPKVATIGHGRLAKKTRVASPNLSGVAASGLEPTGGHRT